MIVIGEREMTKSHTPGTDTLDEPYVRYGRQNDEDTVIVNIEQEYVHAEGDFAIVDGQDFTRFIVSFSFAKSDEVLQSHNVVELPNAPVGRIFEHIENHETAWAEQKLVALFEVAGHMLESKTDFEAFVDGIFLGSKCVRSTIGEKNTHADAFFLHMFPDDKVLKLSFKALFDDSWTDDQTTKISRSVYEEIRSSLSVHYDEFYQLLFSKNVDELQIRLLDVAEIEACANRVRRSSGVCGARRLGDVEATRNAKNNQKEVEAGEEAKYGELVEGSISPKSLKSLEKVSKIGGYMMLGFMVRDIVSDAVNKHYGAMAKDIGFLIAAVSAPTLGELAKVSGSALVASGARFSGNALKLVGFGIQRAISLYVFVDFVENAIAFAKDTSNTEAEIGMAVDGAFLAIDLLTMAASSFGVLAFLAPLGEIAGVILIVGLNIYQTVKRVQQIESIVPLTAGELIDENFRAFFHLNIEDYVQELATEKTANDKLMKDAINYLNNQRQIDTFITESVDFSTETLRVHSDNIIDMRYHSTQRVSRASPGVNPSEISDDMEMACYLHEEKTEIEHKPGFWEKFTGFFNKTYKKLRVIDGFVAGNYVNALQVAEECDDNCIKRDTPNCHNSFGISKKITSQDNAALFKLGSGSDLVNGYIEKPNIFQMADGVKNITAGTKDDVFILTNGSVTGILDASDGFDVLDLTSLTFDALKIKENMLEIIFLTKSFLLVKNFEMIILPQQDNTRDRINVFVGCDILKIVSHGAANVLLRADDCANRDLIVEFSSRTIVVNNEIKGSFIYIMARHDNIDVAENASLALIGDSPANHTIVFMENFWNIQHIVEENGVFFFTTTNGATSELEVSPVISENIKIIFNDGAVVRFNGTLIVSATLSTNLTIKEIAHVYVEALERLGILMVAHSFSDEETITISHGKIEVSGSPIKGHILHNSVDHSTHMMLNGGQYLILINTNRQGKIENTTIKSRNAANITRVVIDLNQVIEYYYRDNDSFVEVGTHLRNRSDLEIEISLYKSGTTVELGSILIRDIFSNNFYSKISIRNYGELIIDLDDQESSVEEEYSYENDFLLPLPIDFGSQSDVVVLTPYNVEPFNEIIFDFNIARLDYYHINKTTLVVTNARYSILNDSENMLTVFLERFYTIEKMTTLQLTVGGVPTKLRHDMDKILATKEFSQLWSEMPSTVKYLIAS